MKSTRSGGRKVRCELGGSGEAEDLILAVAILSIRCLVPGVSSWPSAGWVSPLWPASWAPIVLPVLTLPYVMACLLTWLLKWP